MKSPRHCSKPSWKRGKLTRPVRSLRLERRRFSWAILIFETRCCKSAGLLSPKKTQLPFHIECWDMVACPAESRTGFFCKAELARSDDKDIVCNTLCATDEGRILERLGKLPPQGFETSGRKPVSRRTGRSGRQGRGLAEKAAG